MSESWDCADTKISLGVYVLGAIDPAERSLVDAHLPTCRDCRDELAGLAGIPALLARVNPEEIERIAAEEPTRTSTEPPPELIGTVVSLAAAKRRRSRWRYMASAAAVVAVAAGVFGGLAASSGPAAGPPAVAFDPGVSNWERVSGTSNTGDVTATVAYGRTRWGMVLAAKVEGIPVGTTCQLYIVHNDGTRTWATDWTTASDEGSVWYWGAMDMPGTDKGIASFEVTEGAKMLVKVAAT
jgi:putative zinc finger protein